jgi:hypothetical protein
VTRLVTIHLHPSALQKKERQVRMVQKKVEEKRKKKKKEKNKSQVVK